MTKYSETDFRKGFNLQNCLVAMIEKCKKSLDQGDEYAALLTELSKAFNCLPDDLIIAKLYAYRYDKASLRLMHSHLTGKYQRVQIKNSYSFGNFIKYGVPQSSILRPILCNLFYVICSS